MAIREQQATSTVTGTAADLVASGGMGDVWEIYARDQPIWVKSGNSVTAVASAAGNDYVPAGGWIKVTIADSGNNISAIRASGTNATVTIAKVVE